MSSCCWVLTLALRVSFWVLTTKQLRTPACLTRGMHRLRWSERSVHLANRWLSSSSPRQGKVAVLLSGCGVYDGTEITEAVSVLVHLSRRGMVASCFAPDRNQHHVVDHVSGANTRARRNCLHESARIARGTITPLSDLQVSDFDALVVPGGFGAAKNYSDFAFANTNMQVAPDVEAVLAGFHSTGKPIALCCIAPVLAAKSFPGVTLTVGKANGDEWPFGGTISAVEELGAHHVECSIDQVHVDKDNKVITAPAYMYDGKPHEVFDNVGMMIDALKKMMKKTKSKKEKKK